MRIFIKIFNIFAQIVSSVPIETPQRDKLIKSRFQEEISQVVFCFRKYFFGNKLIQKITPLLYTSDMIISLFLNFRLNPSVKELPLLNSILVSNIMESHLTLTILLTLRYFDKSLLSVFIIFIIHRH